MLNKQRPRNCHDTHQSKDPPTANTKIVLTLDYNRMKKPDNKKGRNTYNYSRKVHSQIFFCKDSNFYPKHKKSRPTTQSSALNKSGVCSFTYTRHRCDNYHPLLKVVRLDVRLVIAPTTCCFVCIYRCTRYVNLTT